MNEMEKMFEGLVSKTNRPAEPGDYEKDGFLFCGKCNTKKQTIVEFPAGVFRKVSVMCSCKAKALAEQRKQDEWNEFVMAMARKNGGISDKAYLDYNFANAENVESIIIARGYVDNWAKMKADNIGLIFSGGVGTGKTFAAGCIANELFRQRVGVCMTNFPRVLNNLQASYEKQEIIDQIISYDLLVIDDLGAERATDYAVEQVYAVIDARYRSGKPLIVTTNLGISELEKPASVAYARVFDRVLEMCPLRVKVEGISRRKNVSKDKADRARKILGI